MSPDDKVRFHQALVEIARLDRQVRADEAIRDALAKDTLEVFADTPDAKTLVREALVGVTSERTHQVAEITPEELRNFAKHLEQGTEPA